MRAVRRGVGVQPGHCGGHRLHIDAGHGQGRVSAALRSRGHHHLGRAGHSHSAVDRDGAVFSFHQFVGGRAIHGRGGTRHHAGHHAGRDHLVARLARQVPAPASGDLGAARQGAAREFLGADAHPHRAGRHLQRHVHPHRGGGDERGVRLHHRRVRLQGSQAQRCAAGAAGFGQYERHAALHHHQRGAVLVPDDLGAHSAKHGAVAAGRGPGADCLPAAGECAAAGGRQCDGAFEYRADSRAHSVSGGHATGHRPDPLRHHHGGEYGSGHVPPAGGPQPLCRQRHRQDGHHRTHHRGVALAADHAGVSGSGDLHPGNQPGVSPLAGHGAVNLSAAQAACASSG